MKYGCCSCNKTTDIEDNGQSQKSECHPCSKFLETSNKQFVFKTFDKLRAPIIIGKFCDHIMHDQIDQICHCNNPEHILPVISGRQKRNRQNAGSHAMSDDNTGRLKKGQSRLCLNFFCHNTPPLILYLSLYIIVKRIPSGRGIYNLKVRP